MSEGVVPEPDPLGDLLAPPPPGPEDNLLRTRLRQRTCRVLRWRRRRQRLAWAAALAGCYATGIATPRLVPTAPAPFEAAHQSRTAQTPPQAPGPALVLEWQAFDSKEHKAKLFRAAGDRYLEAEGDPDGALRCYGAALDAGDDAARAVSSDDSWLLMVLKSAREKEKRHATNER